MMCMCPVPRLAQVTFDWHTDEEKQVPMGYCWLGEGGERTGEGGGSGGVVVVEDPAEPYVSLWCPLDDTGEVFPGSEWCLDLVETKGRGGMVYLMAFL